ncbi:MAG: tetratricopeptide repeat protein [Pseudomonas sp.]
MSRLLICLLALLALPVAAQQAINPATFSALQKAEQAQQNGDLATASNVLRRALGQAGDGSLEQALTEQRLGHLAIARGRNTEAIDWLRRALAHGQLQDQALSQERRNLAQLLAVEGRHAEALALLEPELAAGRLPLEGKRLMVQLYNQLEQYSKALPLAEQVVREQPDADKAWYQLLVGMNYRLQRYKAAERWLGVLLRQEPGNAEYWRQLAGVQSLDRRQLAAAGTLRLAYESGVRLTVQDLDNLVALQSNAGAPWQAARLLEALQQQGLLDTSLARSERLAQLWQQARDQSRALAAWRAVAQRSGRAEHWMRVAAIQLEQGQWDEMLSSLEQARPTADGRQRQVAEQWTEYARKARNES